LVHRVQSQSHVVGCGRDIVVVVASTSELYACMGSKRFDKRVYALLGASS